MTSNVYTFIDITLNSFQNSYTVILSAINRSNLSWWKLILKSLIKLLLTDTKLNCKSADYGFNTNSKYNRFIL